jgi:uncharacterized protein (TIGR01777 family)
VKVIVAGGTGLIGRALTDLLLATGDEVIVLSRRPNDVPSMAKGARLVGWDGESAAGWGQLIDGETAIVNLAGENIAGGRWTGERKRRLRDSRVLAGRAVATAVSDASAKPRVVIQASAVGYYGPRRGEDITESDAPGTDFLARLCVEWEASTAGVEADGVRRVMIRTGVVLSLAGGALPRMALPFRFFVGGSLGSGRQAFPWIHLADEIAAIKFLIDSPTARGAFNLTAPGIETNAEFSRGLGAAIHRPTLLPTPAFALRAVFGEMSTVLLDGQRAIPKRLVEAGYAFRFMNSRTALNNLLGGG